jgi:hypothetical protein
MPIISVTPKPPTVQALEWKGDVEAALMFFDTDQIAVEQPSGALFIPLSETRQKAELGKIIVKDYSARHGYSVWSLSQLQEQYEQGHE